MEEVGDVEQCGCVTGILHFILHYALVDVLNG